MSRTHSRRAAAALAGLALASASLIAVAPAGAAPVDDGPLVTINAGGGTSTTDGLKIDYASGILQVTRDGAGQLYDASTLPVQGNREGPDNYIVLAVGDTIVGATDFWDTTSPGDPPFDAQTYVDWDTITTSGGSATGSGTVTSNLSIDLDGQVFEVDLTIDYTAPADYFTMTYDLTIPVGNTKDVRLGWAGDSQLGGSDEGNQFLEAGPFIGVISAPTGGPANLTKEGVRPANPATTFTYLAGYYNCPFTNDQAPTPDSACPGGNGLMAYNVDLPNLVDPETDVDNGFAYRFPVQTAPGAYEWAVDMVFTAVPPPLPPGRFAGIEPSRMLDTRETTPMAAGETRPLTVAGVGAIPADATALVVNVTATEGADYGYISVFPCGNDRPFVSNVNFGPGEDVPNAATVGIGDTGQICLFTPTATDVVVDAFGYYGPAATGLLNGLEPARLLDTRSGTAMAAGEVRPLTVTGVGGVPGDASGVVLNVTATEGSAPGYISVFPCGGPQPFVSNVNFGPGEDVANSVTVGAGDAGAVCLFTPVATDVVVDVFGYFSTTGGGQVFPLRSPNRLLDTRAGSPLPAGGVIELPVTGVGGVAVDATSVLLNVTATEGADYGYISVYPCGGPQPFVSNVNYGPGQDVPNAVTVGIDPTGTVCLYSPTLTDVVVDVFGYAADVVPD